MEDAEAKMYCIIAYVVFRENVREQFEKRLSLKEVGVCTEQCMWYNRSTEKLFS